MKLPIHEQWKLTRMLDAWRELKAEQMRKGNKVPLYWDSEIAKLEKIISESEPDPRSIAMLRHRQGLLLRGRGSRV